MSKHKLIPYPVIAAAVRGAPEAVNRVLDHYSGYIAAPSMRRGYDQNGNPCLAVDEEIRRRLETRLIMAILDFDLNESPGGAPCVPLSTRLTSLLLDKESPANPSAA